jgi:2-polyprenyl-3-methyl-5-hydroxy-6-metoxy-1,4-benzoquinol methylase
MKLDSPYSVSSAQDAAVAAWNLIRCPVCRASGERTDSYWRCLGCSRSYPRYSQIVDFRIVSGREDLSFAHLQAARVEQERISRAVSLAAHTTFAEMVEAYFREFPTHHDIERGEKGTLLDADELAREVLFQMGQSVSFSELARRDNSVALDIGCGAAGLTGLLATNFSAVIAMDADLDRMMLAERHCAELGLRNVVLLCGYGESMPLTTDAVDFISCVEVLEHASSQPQLIAELQRVLYPGGMLYLTTPNRFSAGREPHVNLWALGWLPRRLMDRYVRFRLGVPYAGKRNLSYWELHRMMKGSFGSNFRFSRPRRSRYTAQARLANSLLQIPGLSNLVRLIVAGYHVVGSKPPRPSLTRSTAESKSLR